MAAYTSARHTLHQGRDVCFVLRVPVKPLHVPKDRVPTKSPASRCTPWGKALEGAGALIRGARCLIDFMINRCRPFIFATASWPMLAVAGQRPQAPLLGSQIVPQPWILRPGFRHAASVQAA
ncbi:hypothetical protein EYE42_02980 [Paracoccus subflavus]|uniref:Uncharacterized protein n=1 Tax=Paracoccus subflavus TaxID=2528244 RepID=A0A4Q9G619_9RHOB|nr:hypothetical protein [Paracoccus subflavus]TBN44093.1 hypothetical protein EYE42_02980 [Paracoccus subflavus]